MIIPSQPARHPRDAGLDRCGVGARGSRGLAAVRQERLAELKAGKRDNNAGAGHQYGLAPLLQEVANPERPHRSA
jgi:hypothetical protein